MLGKKLVGGNDEKQKLSMGLVVDLNIEHEAEDPPTWALDWLGINVGFELPFGEFTAP